MVPINSQQETDGWLGWAVFLGVSWTWCIGMFLPVILIRDYGYWAWVVFAVPNVVGAAAMGWVLSAERSRLMVQVHRPAVATFSAITIAFQIFFAGWAFSSRGEPGQWFLLGVGLIALATMLGKSSRLLAMIVFGISIVCAAGMFHRDEAVMVHQMMSPTAAVAWLTPVCLFGFALCPYLDITFHRARQHVSDRDAKLAFGIGFGVVFLSAIVLSLLYAQPVRSAMYSTGGAVLMLRWVPVYWMVQLGFTIGAHLIWDDAAGEEGRQSAVQIAAAAGFVGVTAVMTGRWLRLPAETIYRGFLGFYGLVFPAYVWLAVVPGRGLTAPTRRTGTILAIAIAIALPMFYLAFIERRLVWGVPGVFVVLLSRAFVSASRENPKVEPGVQQNSPPTS